MEPLDRWTLNVDQDVTPEWWDEKADRQRVEEAVEAWRREHVFTDGEHIVKAGKVYAYDSATVKACGSAKVEAYERATVKAFDSATVTAYNSATATAFDSATVYAFGSATVEAYDSAIVVYHRKNKIVYPARWTAETHD